ncbi:hypothetical protein FDI69_gp224 [Rhodococcus phage Trina]|uniref:Uncharacterized protein n=1 Tax=Rhodococcus phage Trina TaxID=2027905 RepID=A0A2D1A2B8_9CAUD|nr:hypothetical protein FDI69_gp224 [Rhodococcus phage Trina]ASZ74962.1 hypothetical protein SEA_TRINA_174 [Rhodococcus phage Trina]
MSVDGALNTARQLQKLEEHTLVKSIDGGQIHKKRGNHFVGANERGSTAGGEIISLLDLRLPVRVVEPDYKLDEVPKKALEAELQRRKYAW